MPSATQIQPYLFFDGRCEEALDFYRRTLGAEVTALLRFKESPDPGMILPGAGDKVMHAAVRIGESTIMASDGRCNGRRSSRASRCHSPCLARPRPSGCSARSATAGRCRCR